MRWLIIMLAAAWCAVLWVLVLTGANPIVVNPVQVLHADVIVQGDWTPGPTPTVNVTQLWKGTLPLGEHPVSGTLPEQAIAGEVIVPLTRHPDGTLVVTGGTLMNPPRHPTAEKLPAESRVRPLVYPATDGVFQQLRTLLGKG